MAFQIPPPPRSNDIKGPAWQDWFYKLGASLSRAASIAWSAIDFTGSNLTSIATRNHNDLQNLQGGASGDYQHLTTAQVASLGVGVTDGDKGDITVSSSGTVWSLDAATVGITELSATGTPSASTYLRGDNTWATVSGGSAGPAFSAVPSSAQSLATGTYTKLSLQTEQFDTNSCFDNATNYRFTPNVAGYYQMTGSIYLTTTVRSVQAVIYKNGSVEKYGAFIDVNSTGTNVNISALVYMNGSTDYLELWGVATGTSPATGAVGTFFQGFLARVA